LKIVYCFFIIIGERIIGNNLLIETKRALDMLFFLIEEVTDVYPLVSGGFNALFLNPPSFPRVRVSL